MTLGVVGVVRVLVADAHNTSRGSKCQILTKNPRFLSFRTKYGVHPIRAKNLSEKATYNFEKFGKTYLTKLAQY